VDQIEVTRPYARQDFQRVGLEMIKAQGGIFGWVADTTAVVPALHALTTTAA